MADTALTQDAGGDSTPPKFQDDAGRRKKLLYGGVAIILTIIVIIIIIVATTSSSSSSGSGGRVPVMVSTFPNTEALSAITTGFQKMKDSSSKYPSLDGVIAAVQKMQDRTGKNNVDTEGQVTQSAMVMWGPTMESGSVANLYGIGDAVSVAYDVMVYSEHAIIVGMAATRFAQQMGYESTDLNNTETWQAYKDWVSSDCPSPHWRNVKNTNQCLLNGTLYERDTESHLKNITGCAGTDNNRKGNNLGGAVSGSTAMLAIDSNGDMSLATSADGSSFKIAGRISDAAIPGTAGYINPDVGGCVATGDGDTMIRFVPAKTAVTYMLTGSSAQEAAQLAIDEIDDYCPDKQTIVLCLDKDGNPGIANNQNADSNTPEYGYMRDNCQAVITDMSKPTPCS